MREGDERLNPGRRDSDMSSPEAPEVSVLLSVHNGERFLERTLESVLSQTFGDFEFLIVDDASTDETPGILEAYADPRIRRFRNAGNLGLTRSLNRGLDRARGGYIARIDADDLWKPEKLGRQVEWLDRHPGVTVLGTWTTEIDDEDRVVGAVRTCPLPDFLAWEMTHRSSLYHSTALMRREPVSAIGGYDDRVKFAQDHDLWTRIVMAGGRVALLPEPLVLYRRGDRQITARHTEEQLRFGIGVRSRYAEWWLGRPVPRERVEEMMRILGWSMFPVPPDPGPALRLLLDLRRACREDASEEARAAIDRSLRRTVLRRARRLEQGDWRRGVRLWLTGLRTGPGAWRDPEVWREGARLGRAAVARLHGRVRRSA